MTAVWGEYGRLIITALLWVVGSILTGVSARRSEEDIGWWGQLCITTWMLGIGATGGAVWFYFDEIIATAPPVVLVPLLFVVGIVRWLDALPWMFWAWLLTVLFIAWQLDALRVALGILAREIRRQRGD